MFHRKVLLNFFQHDLEPLYSTWWRYKDLLMNFPYHGFSKEWQLEIFLKGLCSSTRIWIERGDGVSSFYQRSVDWAYYLLDDMTEFDYWNWTCSRRNQGLGNNYNSMEQQVDTWLHDQLMVLNEIFSGGVEMIRQV